MKNEANTFLESIEYKGFSDLRAYHIANERSWRFFAFIAIFAMIIVSAYAIYTINQDKHKVIVFERDNDNSLIALGIASKSLKADNKLLAHQLALFISALREVPLDNYIKKRNINTIHKMVIPKIKNQLDNMLIKSYSENRDKAVNVVIDRILPLQGNKSWSIHWHEETYSTSGELLNSASYSSIVSYVFEQSMDTETNLINPLGMFINYINPTQDINDANL